MSVLHGPLAHEIGPLPVGGWLVVIAGGLYIGMRKGGGLTSPAASGQAPAPASDSEVPSPDNANVVLSPIVQLDPSALLDAYAAGGAASETTAVDSPVPYPGSGGAIPGISSAAPAKAHYTAQVGDTVWNVSAKFGITATQLLTLNPFSPAHLTHRFYPGESLRVQL